MQALRFVLAATVLAAASATAAVAQAPGPPAPEPASSAVPAAGDGEASHGRRRVSLFDDRSTTDAQSTLGVDWLSGVEMRCIGCRGAAGPDAAPPSVNANAPWVLQGRWRRRTWLGDVSTGFVGVRDSVLPLSAVVRPDGQLDRVALGTGGTSAFSPGSQWAVTAGIEKTLVKRASGASVGVTGDVFVPVRSRTVDDADPRTRNLASSAVRLGIVVRW